MFAEYTGWHLELTRRCSLKCPACPRTYNFKNMPDPKADINFEHLKRFFSEEYLPRLKYVFFQGNLGDPVYHPQFHDIAEYFFSVQDLSVITNGMQNSSFWQRVLETWPAHASVTLSIDGLKSTNHLYRVHSKWEKIENLFDLIARTPRRCKIEWKFIVFEHNHHQIDEALALAKKVGIDKFRLQKTRVLDGETNAGGFLKEYWSEELSRQSKAPEYLDELSPFCGTGDMHYINAHGEYFPCCWWPGYYQERNRMNDQWRPLRIEEVSIGSARRHFSRFTSCLDEYETSPSVCKIHCRKVKDRTKGLMVPNTQLQRLVFE